MSLNIDCKHYDAIKNVIIIIVVVMDIELFCVSKVIYLLQHDEMRQLRRDNLLEKMTDKDILDKVLGRQTVCLFGWG